jgi:hypothetical protein
VVIQHLIAVQSVLNGRDHSQDSGAVSKCSNITADLKEVGCDDVDRIKLAQNRIR